MTTDDMIHLVLPINPEVAVSFCDESRCWESPFADAMHQAKIPYLANSLLKDAPHKDIINVDIPSERRGKKTWPATVAWRVRIGILSRQHHRVIASYSLSHARSFLVVRRRARFERAKSELAEFQRERAETWERQGIRFGHPDDRPWHQTDRATGPSQERGAKIVDNHITALRDLSNLIATSRERIPRSKENSIKCWQAILALDQFSGGGFRSRLSPQHPGHRDLIEVDFAEFVYSCVGEEMFVKLSFAIDKKIQELVQSDCFGSHFEAAVQQTEASKGFQPTATSPFQQAD
ncbi:uncharacterized protein B0H64DRAFT_440811 [Chaetomium fimeti]|uniref:Uncharacterized protein n=1 Tax=Chaetomium fimeti TaxID=1854472 RepID=A0AAE0HIS6_9PEZI|nr:hypothetical protein B0H64DRAFT_440811 [Chaetomium fimeti]